MSYIVKINQPFNYRGGVMEEEIKKTKEYLDYLQEHYDNVQKAWDIIQCKCQSR